MKDIDKDREIVSKKIDGFIFLQSPILFCKHATDLTTVSKVIPSSHVSFRIGLFQLA